MWLAMSKILLGWLVLQVMFMGIGAGVRRLFAQRTTNSGLVVNIPATALETPPGPSRCFASELPCSAYFNSALRLIEPNNMGAGFVDDAAVACVD